MTSLPRPLFRSQAMATVVGLGLWAAGLYCLHDAYAGRGQRKPYVLRVFAGGPPLP